MEKKMEAHLKALNFARMTNVSSWFAGPQDKFNLNTNLARLATNLITVHPLGGNRMGDDVTTGVTNHWGQVFDAERGGTEVHKGFYVADGSIVPMAIGVNPFLTISAISERNAEQMVDDRNRGII
jgi:choline dehydrogenase-like flavoprotein